MLGAGLLTVALGALAARYVGIPGHRTLYAVIAAPFLAFAAATALLVLLWGRRWALAGLAGAVALALVVVQVPWYVSANPSPDGVALRAMSINMLFGNAEPRAVAELAAAEADVVMLQELTPEAAKGLVDARMADAFPYRALDPHPAAGGIGIYSRYPLTDATLIPGYSLAMVSARISPDGAGNVTVVSMHFAAPWPQPITGWHNDFDKFPGTMADLAAAADGDPVLIGGDFNATIDMLPFRRLLTNGYRDAAEQSGAGRERTFPANKRYPAFMGIDHFLTRDCTATSSHTVEVPGTDHRALIVTVMLPRGDAPTPGQIS